MLRGMPRARLLRHRARLVATQLFSWRQYPKCTANTLSAAIRIPAPAPGARGGSLSTQRPLAWRWHTSPMSAVLKLHQSTQEKKRKKNQNTIIKKKKKEKEEEERAKKKSKKKSREGKLKKGREGCTHPNKPTKDPRRPPPPRRAPAGEHPTGPGGPNAIAWCTRRRAWSCRSLRSARARCPAPAGSAAPQRSGSELSPQ